MRIKRQKSGHVLQKYMMNKISDLEGINLLTWNRMDVFMDEEGTYWLCDEDIKQEDDLSEQGCWRCRESFVMK
ncbi:MAG: hypothetical protein R6V10_07635 [bacterium]